MSSDTTIKIKVTRDMILDDIVKNYPRSGEIMLEYGLHCVGCFASKFDSLEDAMKIHGLKDKDIDEMIERINKIVT